ncbi:MAG: hypothetical protein WAT39_13955 [Planctomycetota bacterium]
MTRSRPSSPRGNSPRPRSDGKVDVSCPQCGVQYRIASDKLDSKIECQECHRVFFAKTTAGKRVAAQDNTKVYVGFGIGAVAVIGIFIAMSSGGGEKPKPKPPPAPAAPQFSRGDHPRAAALVKWTQAIGTENDLIWQSHTDAAAIAKEQGFTATDPTALLKEMKATKAAGATSYLCEMVCGSGSLLTDADMDAPAGKGVVYLTPKPGDESYKKDTRADIELSFRIDGTQLKVTGYKVTYLPVRGPKWIDPSRIAYVPNKDIARPDEVEISDSAGKRKVKESKPAAVPHWDKATPAQQKLADDTVAAILEAADPQAPGALFNKATAKVRSIEDRKAVVPRVLNAMFELYGDVNGNNAKLTLLDKAVAGWTGFAVNYTALDSGNPAQDKADRESCIRQWFAFWYRYANGELNEFIDTRENLDEPLEDPAKKKTGTAGK